MAKPRRAHTAGVRLLLLLLSGWAAALPAAPSRSAPRREPARLSSSPALGAGNDNAVAGVFLTNGAEVRSVGEGPTEARAFVDRQTQAVMKTLAPGESVTVMGAQALEMLRFDGEVARTGKLNPAGDLDLVDFSARDGLWLGAHWLDAVDRTYKGAVAPAHENPRQPHVHLVRSDIAERLAEGWSFNRLSLTFTSRDGRYGIEWAGLGTPEQIARSYKDLMGGVIRHQGGTHLGHQEAVHGLVLLYRYPGMRLAAATERAIVDVLKNWESPSATKMHGKKRWEKVFKYAPMPQAVVERLKAWGVYSGELRTDVDSALGRSR